MKKYIIWILLFPCIASATTWDYTTISVEGYLQLYYSPGFESRQLTSGTLKVSVSDKSSLGDDFGYFIDGELDISEPLNFDHPTFVPAHLEKLTIHVEGPIDQVPASRGDFFDPTTGAFASERRLINNFSFFDSYPVTFPYGFVDASLAGSDIDFLFVAATGVDIQGINNIELGLGGKLHFDGPRAEVPEPTSVALLGLGLLSSVRRRRARL